MTTMIAAPDLDAAIILIISQARNASTHS